MYKTGADDGGLFGQKTMRSSMGAADQPSGGGGGPMPVPEGGPGWRNQGGGSADRWGNTGQVTSDGNGNTSAVTRGDVWGGVGPDPSKRSGPSWWNGFQRPGDPLASRGSWQKTPWDYDQWSADYDKIQSMLPRAYTPDMDTPGYFERIKQDAWKSYQGYWNNDPYDPNKGAKSVDRSLGDLPTGGGGGPMPVPTGGPNWRTPAPVGDQPTGGGGGPMPVPPPWVRFGGKPEDYGVTMEFGGPGAINPPGMNPADLRNLYNPPAPPPPAPNPQASPTPMGWAGGESGASPSLFGQAPFGGGLLPKRGGLGGQDNAPPPPMARPFGGGMLPKRGGLGGQDNAPPPPMAALQGGPMAQGLRGGGLFQQAQGQQPNAALLRYLLGRYGF